MEMRTMIMNRTLLALSIALAHFSFSPVVTADDELSSLSQKVDQLEEQVNAQATELSDIRRIARNSAPLLFLFAAFSALWAQNTGRSAWLWFFLGAIFSVFTVLFVLAWNRDQKQRQEE